MNQSSTDKIRINADYCVELWIINVFSFSSAPESWNFSKFGHGAFVRTVPGSAHAVMDPLRIERMDTY